MQAAQSTAGPIELRLPVDGAEAPIAYPDAEGCLALEVALSGGGYASLVLATADARRWAGEVFAAVSAAYREATGDPHALSEEELACLPPAEAYRPGPALHVCGEGEAPAILRFHLVVDISGECLDAGALRAGIVEEISARFNVTRAGIDGGFVLAGRAS
jgi:hypothetical protein